MSYSSSDATAPISAPLPWQRTQWLQLSRALSAGSLAHAYLLVGSEGLGKSQFAEAFARFALCMSPVSDGDCEIACSRCGNCLKGGAGKHPDIVRIGVEEGSKNIKIDQIRRLSEFVVRSSHSGGVRVAIIEQAHLLNGNAANALLKTLEEPTGNTHLLLVSDYPGRLVATVRSRCQNLAFPTPDHALAAPWLQQCIGGSETNSLLEAAEGRPLIALNLAAGDALQAREQLLQGLCELKRGQKSIQQALALTAKMEESLVLQHFSQFLSKLTKYSLTGERDDGGDSAISDLYSLLQPADKAAQRQAVAGTLSQFYSEVETARRQLASSANPNPQLIMESIMWRWSNLDIG